MIWSDDRCRDKIKGLSEDNLKIISIILACASFGFVFVLYLTMQAVKIYNGLDEDEADVATDDA